MELRDIYAIFYSITFFLLMFYSLFLVANNKKKNISYYFLAAFLIAFALSYTNNMVMSYSMWYVENFPGAIYFGISFELLTGPFLYLYIKSITDSNFKFNKSALLHLIPFATHFLFMTVKYHRFSSDVQRNMLYSNSVFSQNEMIGMLFFNHIHFIVYTSLVIVLLFKYKSRLKQIQSNFNGINLKWTIVIASGLIINWSFHFLNSYLWTVNPNLPILQVMDYRPVLIGSAFIFATILVFKNLQKPDFLAELNLSNNIVSITEEEKNNILNRIMSYMSQEKTYLNPNFNLRMLAENLKEKHYTISKILNHYKQQNFYDFVNEYRIKEAQNMLISPKYIQKNITEIMYECGFNTKSVFNTAFKKNTGMTPRQFRKMYCKEPANVSFLSMK